MWSLGRSICSRPARSAPATFTRPDKATAGSSHRSRTSSRRRCHCGAGRWRRSEHVATVIGSSAVRPVRVATKLTQDRRSQGREDVRKAERRGPSTRTGALTTACGMRGVVLDPARGVRYCDDCRPVRMAEHRASALESGREAMRKAHAERRDPATSPEAIATLRASQVATLALDAAWDREHPEPPDRGAYGREILPGLAGIPLKQLTDVTGLSANGCSKISRGLVVPHPRHWEALTGMAATVP
jgi:hypothetical protein